MSTHILENDILKISVADAGAELCSVLDKELDTERIWTGDPTIWNRHSPILFPFVGRVTGGKYRIGNREYSMKTQHGFARDMVFTCVGESAGSVSHLLLPTEATKEIYPFDFRLLVRHSLDPENPRKILVEWQVENTGADRMYYSIGGHPGFLMPEGVRKEDCFVCFPGRDRLTCFGANGAGFALPGQTKTLTLAEGFAPYRTDIPDTWIFSGGQGRKGVPIRSVGERMFSTRARGGRPISKMSCMPKRSSGSVSLTSTITLSAARTIASMQPTEAVGIRPSSVTALHSTMAKSIFGPTPSAIWRGKWEMCMSL